MIYKRGSAVSPLQARQLIVHRHVKIGDRIVTVPGYHVTADDEKHIQLTGGIGTPKPAEPKQEAPTGEASTAPVAAALANAVFDATGVRLRDVPFTPARVKAALGQHS